MDIEVNYLAVLVAALSSMVLGSLWYGTLFGKQWMALMGFTKEMLEKEKPNPTKGALGAGERLLPLESAHYDRHHV